MKDGPIRRAIKGFFRHIYLAELAVSRGWVRLRGRPSYVLGGECRSCAACCEAPAIRVPLAVFYLPRTRRIFLWWQRVVNVFELTGSDHRARVFTFRCTHFDAETRRCDSYDSRPGMCRDYPRLLLHQPVPELMPSCGYRPIARDAKRRLALLEAEPLTPAQRELLKKKLFLE